MPQILRDERHERMQHAQRGREDSQEIAPVVGKSAGLSQTKLFNFPIPLAKIMPEEAPRFLGRFVIAMILERKIHSIGGLLKPAENPAIFHSFQPALLQYRR